MAIYPEISQRDLRQRSREIMDAVEGGQIFTVTRDGRNIGHLAPIQGRQRFVALAQLATMAPPVAGSDPEQFRADLDGLLDPGFEDPYTR